MQAGADGLGASGIVRVLARLGQARPGSIVSMHFGHSDTVTALPAILRGLTSRGLHPVTLTSLLSS